MKEQILPAVIARRANSDDISLLARVDYEASIPPFRRSIWDELLEPVHTQPLRFLEAMFRNQASRWGEVEDFLILERDGVAAAASAVFSPGSGESAQHPHSLERLPAVAEALRWTSEQQERFANKYVAMWAGDDSFLAPQAEMIIEAVAVLPGHRGQGLGAALMEAAFDEARRQGARSLGVMVIHGNTAAQRLYERFFEPYATFYPAFFQDEFPGITKYRAALH